MKGKLFWLSLAGIAMCLIACNKQTDFATFLVEGDEIEVARNSYELVAKTINGDSVRTYNDSIFTPSYFVGVSKDPTFGLSRASIFFQTRITAEADFSARLRLDSVILTLAYDTIRRGYGNVMEPLSFEVYQLASDLVLSETYYSNTEHMVNPMPIGRIDGVVPNYDSTLSIVEPVGDRLDTNTYVPHLRIPLDSTFGRYLLSFTPDDFVNNDVFLAKFKGIEVRPVSSDGSMVYLDMYGGLSRINLYYSKGDTARQFVYTVTSNSVVANTFDIVHDGSTVGQAIDSEEAGENLLYVQSMGGTAIEFTVPTPPELSDATINDAYLDLTLAYTMVEDSTQFAPFTDVVVETFDDNGDKVLITDVARFFRTNTYSNVYGVRRDEDNRDYFRINVTEYFSQVLSGDASNKIVVSNLTNSSEASRAIFYGVQNPDFKAQLRVTYSDLSSK